MIKEYLTKKLLDAAAERVTRTFEKTSTSGTTTLDLEACLAHHLKQVTSWCSTVSFSELHRPKATTKIFVELSLYVFPRRLRLDLDEQIPVLALRKAVEEVADSTHLVLLGQPGAGKTTAMKYLCHQVLLSDDFLAERVNVPLVFRLRELNDASRHRKPGAGLIFEAIQNVLGLSVPENADLRPGLTPSAVLEQMVVSALEELGALLILDGFDELATDKAKQSALADIRKLVALLGKSFVVVTSRVGDFEYSIDNSRILELSPLNSAQVEDFAVRWLADEETARRFLKEVESSPFSDTQIRPLNLAHLLAIYDRVGRIPEKPKTVYRKIVQLLLEEWDEQRSVTRESRYAGFELDRKFEFLSALAFVLTSRQNRTVFSSSDLRRAYNQIRDDFALPARQGIAVLAEIEGHTGLLIRAGHDLFEFSHKSLQEYLAAEHIVKLPSIPKEKRLLVRIPNELAIAIAISSRPSQYFCELFFRRLLGFNLSLAFLTTFINRILLEKVDFERSLDASVAFVALYSKYMDVVLTRGIQLSLFVSEELLPEFERLAKVLIKVPLRRGMLEAYVKDRTVERSDGAKIFVFRRADRFSPSGFLFKRFRGNVPSVLYLQEGLVEDS